MKFQDHIKQGVKQFRSQPDGPMTLSIISCSEFRSNILTKAAAGDDLAVRYLQAVGQWLDTANVAAREGVYPSCVVCGSTIRKGERDGEGDVVAWVILLPKQAGVGMVAPMCHRCAQCDRNEIVRKVQLSVANETGVMVERLQ